ncbi:MAG: FAD/NAD(P)-binding protein [Acidobacteria bacterium]|nr:FAD/NAD(P)-binding protein [Acidobacteriota bacterium]
MENIYMPLKARVVSVTNETPDVKTFKLRLDNGDGACIPFLPGNFLEVSSFGAGEAPFCISSSPTRNDAFDITVRSVGSVTSGLHKMKPQDIVGIRGPFGNHFPCSAVQGRDILFVGGGIGLPPLRSLIHYMLDNRDDYGDITILYGARTPDDRVYKRELDQWAGRKDVLFLETVDVGSKSWSGRVGVVTILFDEIFVRPKITTAFTCGPPVMIKFVIQGLLKMGFRPDNIVTTLERYMKCGVGKCGHCAVGEKYACTDGPVFTFADIQKLSEKP